MTTMVKATPTIVHPVVRGNRHDADDTEALASDLT